MSYPILIFLSPFVGWFCDNYGCRLYILLFVNFTQIVCYLTLWLMDDCERCSLSLISLFSSPLKSANNWKVSSTVKNSGKQSNWGQNPRLLLAFVRWDTISKLFINALPLVAEISPVKILKVVVLPAPFNPKRLETN